MVLILARKVSKNASQYKKDYSFIVTFNTIIDLIYALTFLFIHPTAIVYKATLIIITENPKLQELPYPKANALVMLCCDFILMISLTHLVHFWYRYDIIVKGKTWSHIQYFLKFLSLFSIVFLDYLMSVFYIDNPQETIQILGELEIFDDRLEAFSMFGTMRAQKTILKTMITQALYPIFVYYIPVTIYISCALIHIDLVIMGHLFTYCITIIPLLNTASVLFLIPSFRNVLRRRFKRDMITTFSEPSISRNLTTKLDRIPTISRVAQSTA
ncbi:unnamed protein product [Bursaphelenchus okinawaensis]|uniref:Uncharacterized protein n=1 Tax=Bursaphelenchus okinawaensis TaxID=465554 RepID=A0A811KY69_9BILA|nr:unnamed protein product [Bursaphelenchus okinawaensis]CAG9113773.1 unnamed protein product [Bursaphelenchus okinawaensis]